ncbi:hypothetical protein NJB95_07450 [Brucella intermedia]|uniref:hypothetical protein n=1 Tax=Brucella intermedia TaxID=94625 RepID=UPI00209B1F23|nr:hypothetical protein [Brucella intermedia]MCO7736445.1 hypothetical protein [Brucella intermedia]
MPVRRKADRRRASFRFDDWEEYLATGIDMFSDLHHAGITIDHEPPSRELAKEAWQALGRQVVDMQGPDCWGAREFGLP